MSVSAKALFKIKKYIQILLTAGQHISFNEWSGETLIKKMLNRSIWWLGREETDGDFIFR